MLKDWQKKRRVAKLRDKIPECNETVYGIKPSSLLTTYTMVVGVISSATLPLIGAIIDHID
jgi:hypothetical protein